MTQEEKDLLLKDLCARFAYHPFVYGKSGYTYNKGRLTGVFSSGVHIMTSGGSQFHYFIEEIKPYLRPMSSMTNEEYEELKQIEKDYWGFASKKFINEWCPNYASLDWLNAHHFDYRGLIEKGLAIAAPKGMY